MSETNDQNLALNACTYYLRIYTFDKSRRCNIVCCNHMRRSSISFHTWIITRTAESVPQYLFSNLDNITWDSARNSVEWTWCLWVLFTARCYAERGYATV